MILARRAQLRAWPATGAAAARPPPNSPPPVSPPLTHRRNTDNPDNPDIINPERGRRGKGGGRMREARAKPEGGKTHSAAAARPAHPARGRLNARGSGRPARVSATRSRAPARGTNTPTGDATGQRNAGRDRAARGGGKGSRERKEVHPRFMSRQVHPPRIPAGPPPAHKPHTDACRWG